MDPETTAHFDAWKPAYPGRQYEPTVGVHDKEQWPSPLFTFGFVCVSADTAGRVCDVRVDETTDASDHRPMLLELT